MIKPLILAVLIIITPLQLLQAEDILFRENFKNLDNWEELRFPKIGQYSRYSLSSDPRTGRNYLEGTAEASASGLIMTQTYNIHTYPILRWRWNIDQVIEKGDARSKDGDDYSIRVYVIFKYDPEEASLGERLQYETAKLIYGEYPPLASVNYVWANRDQQEEFFPNPYTKKAVMFPLRSGNGLAGSWVDEEVNPYEDYLKVFGEPPPREASLAIMVDTDNTGETATGRIEFLEVARE